MTMISLLVGVSMALGAASFGVVAEPVSATADGGLPAAISLLGKWQMLPGHAEEDVAADPGRFEGWVACDVPGSWGRKMRRRRLRCAWYAKRFTVPAEAADLDSEVFFERVHWRAEVWLNGKRLGQWPDGYSPFRLTATDAVEPGAENVLVVRVSGRDEVPKAKCGHLLVPAGFGEGGAGSGGILGDVRVRFFRRVRIMRAQVLPDLEAGTANVLVRVEGGADSAEVELAAVEVPSGRPAGTAKAVVRIQKGIGEATIQLPIKDVQAWEPARPFLYRLDVAARCGGEPADTFSDRFGMRQLAWKADGYYLNGKKLRLFGANIMGEMAWWRGEVLDRAYIKSVIVAPARRINAGCIRTHGGPLPDWWLDVCDEEGLMVLLEFPITVNCARIDFDAAELAAFKTALETEVAALVPYLANHPSILMWVMTNESNNWSDYERGPLFQHFKKLDPSRPAIRAASETPDALDVHCYGSMWKGSAGDFQYWCGVKAARAAAAGVPVTITEYLETGIGRDGLFGDIRKARKWFGPSVDTADTEMLKRLGARCVEFHASRAMEQTEAVRRIGYHGILPFGPGFWQNRDGKPSPTGFAVQSAMAPVGVSLDLFNQHFTAGSSPSANVWVMNDTNEKVAATVTCELSANDPGFDPAAALPKALFRERFKVDVAAHGVAKQRLAWRMPEREGKYFLAARLERPGADAVMSRRVVFAIERLKAPAALTGRRLLVVEGDGALSAWANSLGCVLMPSEPSSLAKADLVVVAPHAAGGEALKAVAPALPRYVRGGGRVLVLEQFDWPRLPDPFKWVTIERTDYDIAPDSEDASGGSSRVFRWEQENRSVWRGLRDESLWRWNGYQGRVARVSLATLPGRARVLVRYAGAERDDLKFVPVAAVPHGRGEVLYFMLQVTGRYRPEDRDFDPVVERLMHNLLAWK